MQDSKAIYAALAAILASVAVDLLPGLGDQEASVNVLIAFGLQGAAAYFATWFAPANKEPAE